MRTRIGPLVRILGRGVRTFERNPRKTGESALNGGRGSPSRGIWPLAWEGFATVNRVSARSPSVLNAPFASSKDATTVE
jgi:hypothetical protein